MIFLQFVIGSRLDGGMVQMYTQQDVLVLSSELVNYLRRTYYKRSCYGCKFWIGDSIGRHICETSRYAFYRDDWYWFGLNEGSSGCSRFEAVE